MALPLSSKARTISSTGLASVVFVTSIALTISSVAQAQSLNPYATTMPSAAITGTPYGSPLDPYSMGLMSGGYGAGQSPYSTSSTAGATATTVSPVEIGNDGSVNSSASSNADGSSFVGGTLSTARSAYLQNLNADPAETKIKKPAEPNEFEKFVETSIGKKLKRFGAELILPGTRDFAVPTTTTVPDSYVLNPGDQIAIGLSGSIDGSVEVEINTDGEIFLPKTGPVKLAGVTYGNLRDVLRRALGKQYRDFRLSVTMARLRGIRVYVTGFANNPGAYTVNSLSTMVNAVLAAGGPAGGGSFRTIKLYRNGNLVSTFDLYDFLRNGDKSSDIILQNQDVLYIAPLGAQVAVMGSANEEAIYETKPNETINNLLRYAGGPNVLADSSRVILYRLANRDRVGGIEITNAELPTYPTLGGDIIQVLSTGSLIQPLAKQSVIVRIEGEVNKPGNYYLPPDSSLDQVMAMAGGLTPKAFIYGTNFKRVSVALQQKESFKEAIKQLEISLAAAPLTRNSAIDQSTGSAQTTSAQATLEKFKDAEPDGRVVLDIKPNSASLPSNLVMENNDRIYVPARPTTVGVFGAVYRPASFLLDPYGKPKKLEAYLDMAGGAIRAGDREQLFVVRANGAVVSKKRGALSQPVLPGDVIFVPVKTQGASVWAKIQQISTVLFQLGLTAAAFVAIAK